MDDPVERTVNIIMAEMPAMHRVAPRRERIRQAIEDAIREAEIAVLRQAACQRRPIEPDNDQWGWDFNCLTYFNERAFAEKACTRCRLIRERSREGAEAGSTAEGE